MLLNSFIFAVSSSIDSLGIGITYGIKNMKISFFSKFILFIISISITYFALFLGNLLSNVLSDFFTIIIGSGILIFMGAYIIYEALRTKRNDFNIFNNPISSDFNHSKTIESKEAWFLAIASKEAIFLGLALSLDSFGIGIGGSIGSINLVFFPIFVSILQLFFICSGIWLGKNINNLYKLPENIWSVISGILLMVIGIAKIFL